MSSYDGEDLFSSGPHRFTAASTRMRVHEAEAPGVDGARLVMLGRGAKRIVQTGRLVADTTDDLLDLRDAITQRCDGRAAVLVDSRGCTHEHMVIERFDTAERVDVGRVASLGYEISYVEAG
ncbi:MAG: hypothetical protein KAS72_15710 [Phycisphaerales bacterium]|nr:hypothetical protein [Phycisphaerales bacterium]